MAAAAHGPLTNEGARFGLVKALCVAAQGAAVVTRGDDAAGCTVAAALNDAQCRFAVLGGRDGMPRSIGSVYAGWTVLFLGSTFTGSTGRLTALRQNNERACRGVAVSRDGSLCFASCCSCIWVLRVHDGVVLQIVGRSGIRALEFEDLYQICCAPDDFVFAAERANDRIHVLTPTLRFHSVVGLGQLDEPTGVCATLEEMVVSDRLQISVFRRRDEARLWRFGKGNLGSPVALCLMAAQRHVAVVDPVKKRVSVFTLDGVFVRHMGVGVLGEGCTSIACTAFDELVVSEEGSLAVFTSSGACARRIHVQHGRYTWIHSVATHGSAVFVGVFAVTIGLRLEQLH